MKNYYYAEENDMGFVYILYTVNGKLTEYWFKDEDKWIHRTATILSLDTFNSLNPVEITRERVEQILFVDNL